MSDKVNVCNTPRPEEFDMAQAVQLTIFTLLGILGWHGVFLLFIVVTFKLFLLEHGNYDCPCDWSAVYGTIMFLCPSFLTYIIAFFAYFRQDDNSVPWKVFRKLYEVKFACHQFDERTVWESHAEYCVRCKLVKRDWSLAKVALSAVFFFSLSIGMAFNEFSARLLLRMHGRWAVSDGSPTVLQCDCR